MTNIVICSIFRDSSAYLENYINQLFDYMYATGDLKFQIIWLTGDNKDNTEERLSKAMKEPFFAQKRIHLLHYDTHLPYNMEGSPERWKRLSDCWNKCLLEGKKHEPDILICVESDLIWNPTAMDEIIENILDEKTDVSAPMLLRDHDGQGKTVFYDTHGFIRGGNNFNNDAPWWGPGPKEEHNLLLPVQSLGGMVAMNHKAYEKAFWDPKSCILSFEPEIKLCMNKGVAIWHP